MKEKIIKMFYPIIIILTIAMPVEVLAATEVAPKGIELNVDKVTMTEKEAKVIEATINPSNATNKSITFSSSDTSIATVNKITKGVKVESGGKLSTGNTVYYIKTAINNKVLSVDGSKTNNSTNIVMKDYGKKDSQKYEVIDAGNGYYIIRIKHSGKVLDVQREGKENSTMVIQYKLTGNDNQLWKLEDAGNGYYYIKSKDSGLYLDVQGGNANDGDKLIIYKKGNNKSNQKFKFVDTGETAKVEEFGMAKVIAKKAGTTTITAKTSNGKTSNCKVKVNTAAIGYGGEKAEKYYFKQTDKKWNSIFFGTWNGTSYNLNRGCSAFAITHCIGVMTEKYDEVTPDKVAAQIRKQAGTNEIFGDTHAIKNVVKLYGLNWKGFNSIDSKYKSAEGIKELLKNGGTIWGSLKNGEKHYTQSGGTTTHDNGHLLMWYKYEDGYFYAKDSARNGGGACKYPESVFNEYVKRANLSLIYK